MYAQNICIGKKLTFDAESWNAAPPSNTPVLNLDLSLLSWSSLSLGRVACNCKLSTDCLMTDKEDDGGENASFGDGNEFCRRTIISADVLNLILYG